MENFFGEQFKRFLAAQYGAASPEELPASQRLEIEDAYYAGAVSGFYHGSGCEDHEAIAADAELNDFGARIVDRYRDAGLPLGQRRS